MIKPMPNMPLPDVYEQEYQYWPWGRLIERVADQVVRDAPRSGAILDYMCGTGYLLHKISLLRPDLNLAGCTFEPRSYVEYANLHYPKANVIFQDALAYLPLRSPDVTICTAGIHHLSREQQPQFIQKVAKELSTDALFIVGESVIREFSNERERRLCALELGVALTQYVIEREPPDDLIESSIDLVVNDVLEKGEYKTSLSVLLQMLDTYFSVTDIKHIWPGIKNTAYGDVILTCRKR